VGVNRNTTEEPHRIDVFALDAELEHQQTARVRSVRAERDPARWKAALDRVAHAAAGADNLVPAIVEAVEAQATVGEISDTMREVFGEFKEVAVD
jgi:methylmalonyl-CoA mutase N-terminal domain/subunit